MSSVTELFSRLSGDAWRIMHPFRDVILQANALLHNPAATEEEMAECLTLWSHRQQPCQFGRVAATEDRIHLCFLRDDEVSRWRDDEIADKISEEKRLWKQRAAFDIQRAAHSFIVVVASPRVALAAPDQHLRAFSDRILELANWEPNRLGVRRENTVTSDYLYLRNPVDRNFYGFQFNLDFFACAGDGRWWQDHCFPGGIAFTANSTGHMMRFRQWYQGKNHVETWALKQAMLTILNSAPTKSTESGNAEEEGRVTWLRSLDESGKPLIAHLQCPLDDVPNRLQGKDWTKYEGLLHTDHAVREEFFFDRDVAPTRKKPYFMDFTYLYDAGQADFLEFSNGKLFSEEHVYSEVGRPEDWSHRAGSSITSRSAAQATIVAEQLLACRRWEPLYGEDDGT
jgi:hypothetical protein